MTGVRVAAEDPLLATSVRRDASFQPKRRPFFDVETFLHLATIALSRDETFRALTLSDPDGRARIELATKVLGVGRHQDAGQRQRDKACTLTRGLREHASLLGRDARMVAPDLIVSITESTRNDSVRLPHTIDSALSKRLRDLRVAHCKCFRQANVSSDQVRLRASFPRITRNANAPHVAPFGVSDRICCPCARAQDEPTSIARLTSPSHAPG